MKIGSAAMISIYQGHSIIEVLVPLMSNIVEDKFSTTVIKFKLREEPENPSNTKTYTKEYKVWKSNSIESYLHNVQDITKACISIRTMNINRIYKIDEQLMEGTNRDNFDTAIVAVVPNTTSLSQLILQALNIYMANYILVNICCKQKTAMRRA